MKYTVIEETKKDFYPTYQAMCHQHNFPAFAYPILPESVFVCYNEDKEVLYSMWAYQTDSCLLWLGFPVSNLDIKPENRIGAFDYLISEIAFLSNSLKFSIWSTSVNNELI